jgi:hypothetical protein
MACHNLLNEKDFFGQLMIDACAIALTPGTICGQSIALGVTLSSLAGRQWIQADDRQKPRPPTNRKESTIESISQAGIS